MTEIQQNMQAYLGIANDDFNKISEFFKEQKIEKDVFLLKSGSLNASLSFVMSGYIRTFNIDENSGKEITQWIAPPGTCITDLSCLLFNTASKWNIQALTDCTLYTIDKLHFNKIGEYVPNWDKLEKLLLAKCFTVLEDRVYSHLALSSEERYKFFFNYNPELFNQVPLQYIASMLGMTPETFSRIRKKISS